LFSNCTKRNFQQLVKKTGVADVDDVITRIVEIEKQCSADVEQARLEYGKTIEAHKRVLDEKKAKERARIISIENARLTQAVENAKREVEADSAAVRRENDRLFEDHVLRGAIKEDIISILLTS
jgi:Fe2+ transport system protein B